MQIVASTQDITVPETYPFPVNTPPPSAKVGFDKGKKRAVDDESMLVADDKPNEDEHEWEVR